MARFLVDKEVEEVYAKGAVLINPELAEVGDIDTAVITLTYQDGTMAIIDNSREASYGYDQRVEVFGSKGMVKADNNLHDTHKLFDSKGSHGALPLDFFIERYKEAFSLQLKSFIKSIKQNSSTDVGFEDGFKALAIADAAYKSLKERKSISINYNL